MSFKCCLFKKKSGGARRVVCVLMKKGLVERVVAALVARARRFAWTRARRAILERVERGREVVEVFGVESPRVAREQRVEETHRALAVRERRRVQACEPRCPLRLSLARVVLHVSVKGLGICGLLDETRAFANVDTLKALRLLFLKKKNAAL